MFMREIIKKNPGYEKEFITRRILLNRKRAEVTNNPEFGQA